MHAAVRPTAPAADELSGRLTYIGHPPTVAALSVRRRDKAQRTARALKTLGACWGLAVLAVLVPVLHFVLVPGLLIAGPVMALARLRERVTVLEVSGPCPGCGAPMKLAVNQPVSTRMGLRCEACHRAIDLEPDPEALTRD